MVPDGWLRFGHYRRSSRIEMPTVHFWLPTITSRYRGSRFATEVHVWVTEVHVLVTELHVSVTDDHVGGHPPQMENTEELKHAERLPSVGTEKVCSTETATKQFIA